MPTMKIMMGHALAAMAMLGITACGGGGGSSGGSSTSNDNPDTGVLLDAEVAGVTYQASPSGLTGVTNADGEYNYRAGDTVTFSVGGITLGSAPASGVMTPVSLAEAATITTSGVTSSDIALNIAVFLQSFDSDGNPDNGISIDSSLETAATDLVLNFEQTTSDFSSDATLNTLASDEGVTLVSTTDAKDHSDESLMRYLSGSWLILDDPGSELAVLTLLPDGQYVLGIQHVDPNCANGLEYGTYSIDSVNMTLQSTSVSLDSTGPGGDCGLYESGAGEVLSIAVTSESDMAFVFTDGEINLSRVENSGIHGSWTEWSSTTPGNVKSVVTLLDNGNYMVSQVEDEPGIETGTYTVDSSGVISASPDVDTNGSTGLSHAASDLTVVGDGYGRLQISSTIEGFNETFTSNPYTLSLPGNTATSVLTNSECPSTPGGWDYTFNDTTVRWVGVDGWDSSTCTLLAGDDFTVSYDEFLDTPISCGPVCSLAELNMEVSGVDNDGRNFSSTWSHEVGTNVIDSVKTLTDSGKSWTETITLQ